MKQLSLNTISMILLLAMITTPAFASDWQFGILLDHYSGADAIVLIPDMMRDIPVVGIGERCFAGNEFLEEITLSKNVTIIGAYAFTEAESLRTIHFVNQHYSNIEQGAFSLTAIEHISLPQIVDSLGDSVFYECSELVTAELPKNIIFIPEYMFFECERLVSVEIPSGVLEIGADAFYGCISLSEVFLPRGVLRIGESAFSGCDSLAYCELPDTIKFIGADAFEDCDGLTLGVYDGSYAQEYAEANGMSYQLIF